MRSDLRALRERIRQVEAGGHRDTPLRRAYNRKLRAHKGLKGGGGDNGLLQSAEEIPDYSFDVKLINGPTINHNDYHILMGKTKSYIITFHFARNTIFDLRTYWSTSSIPFYIELAVAPWRTCGR